jgi:hypothetical protein
MDLAAMKAWLDTNRPGWATEPEADVLAWANALTEGGRPARIPLRSLAEWAVDEQVHSGLIAFIRDSAANQNVKDRAQAILKMLRRPGDLTISTTVADSLVGQMEAAGICTTVQADAARLVGQEWRSPAQVAGVKLQCPTVLAALKGV